MVAELSADPIPQAQVFLLLPGLWDYLFQPIPIYPCPFRPAAPHCLPMGSQANTSLDYLPPPFPPPPQIDPFIDPSEAINLPSSTSAAASASHTHRQAGFGLPTASISQAHIYRFSTVKVV